jgi:predicted ATPase
MLQLSLGELLIIAKGAAVPEVGEAYTRAYTLCHQIGESSQHFQALQGLQRFHVTQAQLPAAGELAQQLTHLAHRQGEVGRVLEGQAAVGAVALLRGDLVAGRALLESYLSLSDPLPPAVTTFHGVRHLRVTYLAWMMQVLWELGYAAQARQRHAEMLAQAQQLGHPPNLVYAQCFGAFLAQYCRDAATTYDSAEAVTAFATAQGLEHNVVFGRILLGWSLALQGDAAAGVAHIQQGLDAVQRTGLKLYRPYFLALLAEAYGQAGHPEAGLTALAEAMTLVAATEERWWEAEVYRLQGVLLLQRSRADVGQAEACFQQALEVARRQQAKALELRTALSLARLWQKHGKRQAVHDLLVPVYDWFTEGFDTADLQEARALLEACAAG